MPEVQVIEPAEVVDMAGFAELCGYTYRSVLTMRSAGVLPEPAGFAGQSPWWLREEVVAWRDARRLRLHPTSAEVEGGAGPPS